MISEANEKTKDRILLEEYDINSINKETLKDYRIRFRIHKGEAHEWNKLDDEEFLYMLNAIDRKTKKLTIAGLLMFGQEKGWILPEIKESFNPNRTTLILITKS